MLDIDQIQKALDVHLDSFEPRLTTVWDNKAPPANFDANKPHQKAFLMPAKNRTYGLREERVLQSGIYQVNLCYPTGIGAYDVKARGSALAKHFKGRSLAVEGGKIRIVGHPDVASPSSLSPYVVPVSISYESINQ